MKRFVAVFLAATLLFTISLPSLATAQEKMQQANSHNKSNIGDGMLTKENKENGTSTLLATLNNGMQVLIKEDSRFPLVSIRLYVHAGSTYESPKQAGISHLLEHMVFKGTKNFPQGSIATEIEKTGGYLNAATSLDYTMYLTDMTSEHWIKGLHVLKEMVFLPSIESSALESEKEVVVAELKRGKDSPQSLLFEMAQKAGLAETPYAAPIIGFEDTIRSITSADMHMYMNRLYKPHSMLLMVVGDVNTETALKEVQNIFGNLPEIPQSTQTPELAIEAVGTTVLQAKVLQQAQIQTGPWNKVHLAISIPVSGYGDMQSTQLDVLAQLLGSGPTSRFNKLFKYEKRLVDSIAVENITFENIGMLYIQAILDSDKLEAFWLAFGEELAQLHNISFTPEQLHRAKINIEDSLFRYKETIADYASKLGYFMFFGKGETDEKNYLQTVHLTGQDTLTNLIGSVFIPEKMGISVLLPESMPLEQGKESLGNWLRASLVANFSSRAENTSSQTSMSIPTPEVQTKSTLPQSTASLQHTKQPTTENTQVNSANTPEIIELGQGRTIILQKDTTLPYADISLRFLGGEQLLSPKQAGLAMFTASLLGKGTHNLPMQAFEEYKADRAAGFSANAGKLSFNLHLHTPAKYMGDMLALMLETISSPAFLEEEASRVKDTQIASIALREDQPTGLAFRRLFPFVFGEHVYGLPSQGYRENIATFTALDAKALWGRQQQYPWILSVAGDFDKDAILEFAQKLPVPKTSPIPFSKPEWGKERELTLHLKDRQQSHLLLIFPTVGIENEDKAGLNLLHNILTGQSGLLFTELRDKQGLGYTVTALPWISKDAGFLAFYIGTNPEQMDKANQGFLDVIKSLQTTPIPQAELERGKNQLVADLHRARQILKARSEEMAELQTLGLPLDANEQLVEQTMRLTAEDLQRLAKKYLIPEKAYILKVLP